MKGSVTIHRFVVWTLLGLAAISGIASLLIHASPLDTEDMASHVSERVQHRMELLDSYADRLLSQSGERWIQLKGFPDDMVIYRYENGILGSWYNLFSVGNDDIAARAVVQTLSDPRLSLTSPLSQAGPKASYVNLGPNWYLLKAREEGNVKVVEGLLVKSEVSAALPKGSGGVNPYIHTHGRYSITPLSEGEGEPIYIDGEPVFTIVAAQSSQYPATQTTGILLRFIAIILLIAALLAYLLDHRSLRNMCFFASASVLLAFLCRALGTLMSDYVPLFSPALYAHDNLLNSFGTLLSFNLSIFLGVYGCYICRDRFAGLISSKRGVAGWLLRLLPVLLEVALLYYIFHIISSLILNSSITLDLYHFNDIGWYTVAALLTLGMLFVAVLMLARTAVQVFRPQADILRPGYILAIASIAAVMFSVRTSQLGFVREQNRVQGWCNRLAVDRDLVMELQLRHMEEAVATDPILYTLVHMNGAEQMILRRLDEMYFGPISAEFDVAVRVSKVPALEFGRQLESLIGDGSPVGPQSHFFYTYNPASGSRYIGIFQYPSQSDGLSSLVVEVTPKIGSLRQILSPGTGPGRVSLPPIYSYARYYEGHLVSFDGSFAYPTVIDGITGGQRSSRRTFTLKGYRHFVGNISDDETIIITRRQRGAVTYFVTFTYLALYLFLLGMILRGRSRRDDFKNGFFSIRIRRLVVLSLTVTLILMASVSVLFVYQRNQRGRDNQMASKISSLQLMLGGACRQMESADQMRSPEFVSALEEITATTNQDINLYTPDGRLLLSSSSDARDPVLAAYRIAPQAYQAICLGHQRYFISSEKVMGHPFHVLYAPVFNSTGAIVAIASSIYSGRDYDFTRDAVFHAATVVSVFLILLLVTVVLFSSIARSIFRPLLAIGQKMKGINTSNLEKIDYQGDDEISSLVEAYNDMVEDLRESTMRLTAAERDKAWSEMARQVAHEIKNPLTPIKLEIQRIQRLKQKGDPSWQEKFDSMSAVVLEHIDILSQTANEFSTFAKLYSEDPVEIDLDKAVRDEIMLFSSNEKVQITYLGAADAIVSGPKPQLVRVFVNLISNAVQAVEAVDNPTVLVSLRRGEKSGWWDISFEDNGPGVSEDNRSKLFTPNFTTKSSGTGLGLAISRNIVERCGGTIKYSKSFSLGGACFTVSLPSNKQTPTI